MWKIHFSTPEICHLFPRRSRTLILLTVLLSPLANGAEITDIEMTRNGSRYLFVSTTHFDATPEQVFRALIDYDRLADISKAIKESRYMEPGDDGQILVYTRIGTCVFLFCRTIEKIEHLNFTQPTYIQATAIPDRSDVLYSRSEWELAVADGGGTQVIYRLEFEPDFWVPPLIGSMIIKRILVDDGASAVDQIEKMAQKIPDSGAASGT